MSQVPRTMAQRTTTQEMNKLPKDIRMSYIQRDQAISRLNSTFQRRRSSRAVVSMLVSLAIAIVDVIASRLQIMKHSRLSASRSSGMVHESDEGYGVATKFQQNHVDEEIPAWSGIWQG